jgi:hypothetical protein
MAVQRSVIDGLITAGRSLELWRLAAGTSKYCGGQLRKSFRRENVDKAGDELWCLAVRYLNDFTFRGPENCHEYEKQAFEKWIDIGSPFLFEDEIEAYLGDHPLDS